MRVLTIVLLSGALMLGCGDDDDGGTGGMSGTGGTSGTGGMSGTGGTSGTGGAGGMGAAGGAGGAGGDFTITEMLAPVGDCEPNVASDWEFTITASGGTPPYSLNAMVTGCPAGQTTPITEYGTTVIECPNTGTYGLAVSGSDSFGGLITKTPLSFGNCTPFPPPTF
ncbi:MAG: hypothetical protein AAF436_09745 [Myxococcota bacterium]